MTISAYIAYFKKTFTKSEAGFSQEFISEQQEEVGRSIWKPVWTPGCEKGGPWGAGCWGNGETPAFRHARPLFLTSCLLAPRKGTPFPNWPQGQSHPGQHHPDQAQHEWQGRNSDKTRDTDVYPTTTDPPTIYEAPTMSQLLGTAGEETTG